MTDRGPNVDELSMGFVPNRQVRQARVVSVVLITDAESERRIHVVEKPEPPCPTFVVVGVEKEESGREAVDESLRERIEGERPLEKVEIAAAGQVFEAVGLFHVAD